MAEYSCLPARNLHLVPENIADRVATFTEPLAAACKVLDQIHVQPTDRVVILGDGKLGLLVAQVLDLTGCHLTVVGRHEAKLAILAALIWWLNAPDGPKAFRPHGGWCAPRGRWF